MNVISTISSEMMVKDWQVKAVVDLIDEGNTIPFIARYRKEQHGSLDDEKLRFLEERLGYLRNLEDKKQTVIATIDEQGKLTDELRIQIDKVLTLVALEDLYRPYKPKRKTRASVAKERGLDKLANYIMANELEMPIEDKAQEFINPSLGVNDVSEAMSGASDIIAEDISDNATYRNSIRKKTFNEGIIVAEAKEASVKSVYEMYYSYEEKVNKMPGHRILAINRGEKEKILTVKIKAPTDDILIYLQDKVIVKKNKFTDEFLRNAIADSYKRLIAPAIERDIRNELTTMAEDGAINVFGKNLEKLLMTPPIQGKTVLGWDPGFRTGCKIAVVDVLGNVVDTTVIYPTEPHNKIKESKEIILKLIDEHGVDLISLGNGTASRESEMVVVDIIKEAKERFGRIVQYIIVNEAGASVYSASKVATEEFPDFDVGQRSSASMARRLQDPLAELVKIDPKSIGVGQYQHDMNQKKLSQTLSAVVEDCVNKVGVDLNTASKPLLEHVAGITPQIALNIVNFRCNNGRFNDRNELLKVPKLGEKAFKQCAGFMRINDGKNPLDATSVHPESYAATLKLLDKIGMTVEEIKELWHNNMNDKIINVRNKEEVSKELNIGIITLEDILCELSKPGRDPRETMPSPVLKSDILDIKDLKPGMILKGTIRNVIDFGAFVDIGIHHDGLVHISRMSKKYIKHPLEVVSVGDIIDVKIIDIELDKNRVSLSMILDE